VLNYYNSIILSPRTTLFTIPDEGFVYLITRPCSRANSFDGMKAHIATRTLITSLCPSIDAIVTELVRAPHDRCYIRHSSWSIKANSTCKVVRWSRFRNCDIHNGAQNPIPVTIVVVVLVVLITVVRSDRVSNSK
jgi:hypothetical protein